MTSRLNISLPMALTLWILLLSGVSPAQSSSTFSLGDRISCRTAIEQVYWRHRTGTRGDAASKISFEESVPPSVIQRNAEDTVLKSAALERFWGVTITDSQLQAELDRMAKNSKAPDVLAELLAALDNDPQKAAECLARPLLVDRLIQTYYRSDERFHGALKSRAQSELAAGSLRNSSGQYREVEWNRGRDSVAKPGVIQLESSAFEERVRDLKRSLGGASGNIVPGRVSRLQEDSGRFYAVSVIALDNSRVRVASVEWPKISFDAWWAETRQQLPMTLSAAGYSYTLPLVAPNANCRDDSWKPTLQLLDPRYWHTAVWTGTEMIVWGGMQSVGTEYNDGSRYNPATDTWTPVASLGAPSARSNHVAVWTGKEMVIFGGTGDNTGGRYNPATDTWRPTSTIGAPVGQSSAVVAWTGKEMLVWGGYQGTFGTSNSGARYNPTTNTWTPMAQSPLAGRAQHSAVWTGTEFIIWGGYDGFIGQMYGDGARYNPATNTWKLTKPSGAPNARFWHTAVWTGSEMIVWGGENYPTYDLSGGRYNPATDTWTPTSLVNPPSLRWMHAAVWTGTEMIIQGGTPGNPVGGRYNPATDTWKATSPTNAANNGQGITAVWTRKEIILWGGLDDNFLFHYDGGRYNPAKDRWLRTGTMNVPQARSFHSGVWTGSEMIIWGGIGDTVLSDGGRYDPVTDNWKMISNVSAPLGGGDGQGVWSGSEAIFWVGSNPGGRYNPVTDSWKLMSIVNAPSERLGHTTVWTGTELIVFGGIGTDSIAKRYNPANDTWTNATAAKAPGPRDHHGAVWTGTEMIIWGGFINDGITPTGGRYNPATDTWRPTNLTSSPPTRMFPIGVWTGTEAIFWGGYDWLYYQYYNDGGRYNPQTDTWTKTSLLKAPSPRAAQGVWTGQEMLLWGGADDSSGGRYNSATDSWKSTTLVNVPAVRFGGRWSTVWTGNQMIIWGGYVETQQGSLYCASGTPNAAPVASDDSYTALANQQLVVGLKSGVLLNDTDANGDPLTAKGVSKPAHGTLQFNSNGSFTYKPTAGYVGPDSFTYQARDGLASSNIATVQITVQ